MEELDVNNWLLRENLFELFTSQLKKDFESAGAGSDLLNELPAEFELLKVQIMLALRPLINQNSSVLPSLLYRIDISEKQLRSYRQKNENMPFDEVVAELIIKRILQKVILKRTFSKE